MNQIIRRVHARQRGTERFRLEAVAQNDFGVDPARPRNACGRRAIQRT